MSHRSLASVAVFTAVLIALGGAAVPLHAAQDIVIGLQCDRTGPTQTVGVVLCPGYHDYVDLVNSQGGVAGHMIRVHEIDHEYKVPPAVEAYERFKSEGAALIALYGTPQTYALTEKLTEDRIPGTSPGFGRADAADGIRYPYIFPIAATYWSQATAAVQFVKNQLKDLHGKKIAYLFYDNPAGREPLPVLEDLAAREGFQLKTFAVPPPGLEMGAPLPRRLRHRPPVRTVAVRLHQGAPSRRLPAEQGGLLRLGLRGGGHSSGRRVRGRRRLLHDAVRGRRLRLPRAEGHPRHVPEGRQGASRGDGVDRVLQPRRAAGGARRRGDPQCPEDETQRSHHR